MQRGRVTNIFKVDMRFLAAIFGCFIVVWMFSMLLGYHTIIRAEDSELGLLVRQPGSMVVRMGEGAAVSHYGAYGINRATISKRHKDEKFVLLHGDSFIEAMQVSDENKPDAVLTRLLGGSTNVYGVGLSGAGFASMIGRARKYEQVLGRPVVHVFFTASGIREDILGDPKVWESMQNETLVCPPERLPRMERLITRFINKTYFTFLATLRTRIFELTAKWNKARGTRAARDFANENEFRDRLEIVMKNLEQLRAPCVIVYCPDIPKVKQGALVLENPELKDVCELKEFASKHKIGFVDTADVQVNLYKDERLFVRGFSNLGGPGSGHLNPRGVEAVFSCVADYLRRMYAL